MGADPSADVAVVSITGEIDLANAESHADVLCALLDLNGSAVLVVDCSELELLESQGMAMMHRVHRHGEARPDHVGAAGLAPRHLRVLEVSGLDRFLHVETGPVPGRGLTRRAIPPR